MDNGTSIFDEASKIAAKNDFPPTSTILNFSIFQPQFHVYIIKIPAENLEIFNKTSTTNDKIFPNYTLE